MVWIRSFKHLDLCVGVRSMAVQLWLREDNLLVCTSMQTGISDLKVKSVSCFNPLQHHLLYKGNTVVCQNAPLPSVQ